MGLESPPLGPGSWPCFTLLSNSKVEKTTTKQFIGGCRRLPQIWCDFIGQVSFKLKTLFPSLLPCLVPLSVLVKGNHRWPWGSPLSSPRPLVPVPAVLGAPSRWVTLICGLQARRGILRLHVTFWKEGDLVNKHSPRRGRGEG